MTMVTGLLYHQNDDQKRRRQQQQQPPVIIKQRLRGYHYHSIFSSLVSVVLFLLSSSLLLVVKGSIDVANNEFGYTATTDVGKYLQLAYDIRDMRSSDDMVIKKGIYENGKNAIASNFSLQDLSLNAETLYKDTPLYNLYRESFNYLGQYLESDSKGQFDGRPIAQYTNTLVNDLFDLSIPYIEATGSLVYNVVMAYWSQLWLVLDGCKNKDASSMNSALDIAVALYVGEGQVRNENSKGYMLYNMAEVVGTFFGQDSGESQVNKDTLITFLNIQNHIKNGNCATAAGYIDLRNMIRTLYQHTNRVLMQWLLYHIQNVDDIEGSSNFIEMYSLSLWPQIHMCNPTIADELVELTITEDTTSDKRSEIITILQEAYNTCLGISCVDVGAYQEGNIPQCEDDNSYTTPFGSYTPTVDVRDISRLDLDLNNIRLFTMYGASVAYDWYVYGWHSSKTTLQQVATCQASGSKDLCDMYLNAGTDVDETVKDLLTDTTIDANSPVRYGEVGGLLQGYVMYIGVGGFLDAAITACNAQQTTSQILYWESAIALFVGSLVSTTDSEDSISFYGLSQVYCEVFGTCPNNDEPSSTNVAILDAFSTGANMMNNGTACEVIDTYMRTKIYPSMLIPLIQAYLANMIDAANSTDTDASSGYAAAFSFALLPYVMEASSESATIVRQVTPSLIGGKASISTASAFDAIRTALKNMTNVDCSAIGGYNYNGIAYGLCPNDPAFPNINGQQPAPAPTSATNIAPPTSTTNNTSSNNNDEIKVVGPVHPDGLAWGRYTFVDKEMADQYADFTLDVKGMYYSKSQGEADAIYGNTNGTRSVDIKGVTVNSLQEFSTKAYLFMNEDPIYNFFRYALFEDSTFDDTDGQTEDFWAFENAIEQLAVGPDNGNSPKLASETSVVMGIWHVIAHFLYEASRQCKLKANKPELIDYAVALWIGKEQGEGIYNSGWSMYSVAQNAAQNFGLPEREAAINSALMDKFNSAQAWAKQCSDSSTAVGELHVVVDDILRSLSIPLAQNLLYYISKDDYQYVELYSLSVIPQAISCDQGVYDTLRDALFDSYTQDNFDFVELDDLSIAYNCLRFKCSDFAIFNDDTVRTDDLGFMVDTLCDELDFRSSSKQISAYAAENDDAMELARIDLDVLQMEIFVRIREYNLAYDIYANGRNSRNGTAYNTLKNLAASPSLKEAGDWYELQTSYFGTDNVADGVITSLLQQSGNSSRYSGASRRQLSEIVFRTLQTSVTPMAAVAYLEEAVRLCNMQQNGVPSVDFAAALYIGSIEGPVAGGSEYNSGKLVYAFAKEFCEEFNKCDNHTDAKSNEFLIFAFEDIRDDIADYNCDSASVVLKESVQPIIESMLIQGLLHYAVVNEDMAGSSGNETIAAGAAVADSLLPIIKESNGTSADTIESSMKFSVSDDVILSDHNKVFDAVRGALEGMKIDCSSIGTHESDSISLCGNSSIAPPMDTETNLGGDLYVSSTYVQDKANIALDIKQMEDSLQIGRETTAMLIYQQGENSDIYDASGKRVDLRSLASFSLNAWDTMKNNPLYQMTVFALRDDKNQFGGAGASKYADTIVQQMFALGKDRKLSLAAEAALALNLWMELANDLFITATKCKNTILTTDDGIHAIDGAAAYWIGDGQIAGDAQKGHLLYALAEEMGDQFGMNTGQSRTNQNILLLFHKVKMELSQSSACADSDNVHRVRRSIDKIISMMVVVQIQALIHYLLIGDKERVKIYAHAFVPLVVGCNPSTFKSLKSQLLEGQYKESELENILADIRSTLPCFGLSCEDIGKHRTEDDDGCSDPNPLTPLAGYKPSQDVREYAKLDLDILELDILMQMEAYEAAADIYAYGKHASMGSIGDGTALSLKNMATSSGRSVVPQFASFKRYFDNEDRYADLLIQKAFATETTWKASQRRVVAVGVSQYMIVYMAALQAMYEAVGACSSGGSEREVTAAKSWDKAAAFIVGYLEGTTEAGSDDGLLFWHLSKVFCAEFDTCSSEVSGSSISNDKIDTMLYAGRGAIISGNCDELRKAAHGLSPVLLVPLIQGSLSATTKLTSRSVKASTAAKEQVQAEAFIYAQSILPLIQDADREAASVISKNSMLTGTSVPGGLSSVVSAFANSLSHLGIECEDVGVSTETNVCTGVANDGAPTGLIVGITLVSVAIVGSFLLYRKRKKSLPENTPEFKEANGVLNHTSDLLAKSPDASQKARSDAETDYLNGADADCVLPEDDDAYVEAISRALDERDSSHQEQAPKVTAIV